MTENEAKYTIIEYMPVMGFPKYRQALRMAIKALEEIQQYRAIGTIDEFKALKEKNEPKKLNNLLEEDGKIGGYCPNCNGTVLIQKTFLRTSKGKCCDWCGQKIDWQ